MSKVIWWFKGTFYYRLKDANIRLLPENTPMYQLDEDKKLKPEKIVVPNYLDPKQLATFLNELDRRYFE